MDPALSVAALVTLAAITPGPNNFIVLAAAMSGGAGRAVTASLGIICGSLALLALVLLGLGALLEAAPAFVHILTLASAGYIAWLALAMIARAGSAAGQGAAGLPASLAGIALFQIVNPKAWALVVAAVTATAHGGGSMAVLAAILTGIMTLCLTVWALFGVAFSAFLSSERARTLLDRALGTLLFATALALAYPAVFP